MKNRVFLIFLTLFLELSGPAIAAKHGLGLIQPADWEDRAEYLGILYSADLPMHFDWREKLGKQVAVKNQGSCGSCWAFSRTSTLEWQYLIQGQSVTIAPQELVSCDREELGCGGGFWTNYEVVTGISEESEFPYVAYNARCKKGLSHQHKIAKWLYIGGKGRSPSVEEMKQAIYQYGPIGVTVAVTGRFPNGCAQGQTNHMTVVVGWDEAKKVWLMQNSWGEDWGNGGYADIGYGCFNIGETAAVAILK